MADEKPQKISIGFIGGQVLAARVAPHELTKLRNALPAGGCRGVAVQCTAWSDRRPRSCGPRNASINGVRVAVFRRSYAPSDRVAASTARVGQRSWVSGTIIRMVKPSRV